MWHAFLRAQQEFSNELSSELSQWFSLLYNTTPLTLHCMCTCYHGNALTTIPIIRLFLCNRDLNSARDVHGHWQWLNINQAISCIAPALHCLRWTGEHLDLSAVHHWPLQTGNAPTRLQFLKFSDLFIHQYKYYGLLAKQNCLTIYRRSTHVCWGLSFCLSYTLWCMGGVKADPPLNEGPAHLGPYASILGTLAVLWRAPDTSPC